MANLRARLLTWVAQGFGVGRIPCAPGTFGTGVGVLFYLGLMQFDRTAYLSLVFLLFVFGVWVCGAAREHLGREDHPSVVWDEIVGYLITMATAPSGWLWLGIGFVLFRLFDIWKPFPIRWLDCHVHGGFGTMLDDVVAGLYAWAVMIALGLALM
jgi:phosphatidylglycerophosphatase A